jgi:hypothetical protein
MGIEKANIMVERRNIKKEATVVASFKKFSFYYYGQVIAWRRASFTWAPKLFGTEALSAATNGFFVPINASATEVLTPLYLAAITAWANLTKAPP